MKQVVVLKNAVGMELAAVDVPEAAAAQQSEAVVQVHSISLNRGEVTRAFYRSDEGWRPGWDFAGTIVRSAQGGPPIGTRVAGFKSDGAWAERIVVQPHEFAVIPDNISFEVAATLPIAGLTALYALEKGGALLGKSVLVTGATGGVGQIAVQLALRAGASVTAAVYRNAVSAPTGVAAERFRMLRADADGLKELRTQRHDLVIESVGGDVFNAAVESLAPGGTIVLLGATRDAHAQLDIRTFFHIGRARIYGFTIFDEVSDKPISSGLAQLFTMIARKEIEVPVTYRGSVAEIDRVARALLDSKIPGKAVLTWNAA